MPPKRSSRRSPNVEFALAWPAISKSFAATGRFAWDDQLIDATLSLTDFVAALTGDRSVLKLRLSGSAAQALHDGFRSVIGPSSNIGGSAQPPTLRHCAMRCAGPSQWTMPCRRIRPLRPQGADHHFGARRWAPSGVNVDLDGNVWRRRAVTRRRGVVSCCRERSSAVRQSISRPTCPAFRPFHQQNELEQAADHARLALTRRRP